jgi:hypothetical protein
MTAQLANQKEVDEMDSNDRMTKQFLLTPSAGKRLIARAVCSLPSVAAALRDKTIVIIAGTTNGYVAEELLLAAGQAQGFSRNRFFRGITLPPGFAVSEQGRLADENGFPGDVVIRKGIWDKGKTIGDVVDELGPGDIVIKGANAVSLSSRQAAILIGHPRCGTIGLAMPAVIGRRVELIIPVGLEKRVDGDLSRIAAMLNAQNAQGCRYYVAGGQIVTELDAIRQISGAETELVAAGGICGAEGSCWIAVSGLPGEVEKAQALVASVAGEPAFSL